MTPITDKQRVDFVQRHKLRIDEPQGPGDRWKTYVDDEADPQYLTITLGGHTWRQAVDKAIRAYQKGSK